LLSDVCLVRNYAKVTVTVKDAAEGEDAEPYKLLKYALINVPGSGSVAPWNTGLAQYEPLYMNILSYADQPKGAFYERLSGTYFGYMPNNNDIIRSVPKSFVTVDENGNSAGDFMFERTMFTRQSAPNSQTGFLALIQWTADTEIADGITIPAETEMWYKIEITGPDGEYIPFLRNILYSIKIEGIHEKGWASPEEAMEKDFAGDVSIGLALSSLNELSNGVSSIRVNHTEYTSNGQPEIDTDNDGTADKVPDYVIEWQYFPNSADATGTAITKPGTGTLGGEEYDVAISMYDLTSESAIDCDLTYLLENQLGETRHDGQTWGTITVPISELGKKTKTSVVRISGQYGTGRRIFREVIINVVSTQNFVNRQPQSTDPSLKKTTYIEADEYDGLNKKVVVHFSLPNDLGASLFPLNIKIEAADNNLTSTSPDLPVNSGVSAFSSSDNSFYFIRQVTLDEYRWIEDGEYKYKNDYTATLFTNKMSGNSTSIRLSDEKGFMNPETLDLTVGSKILSADPESQTVAADVIRATVNVTASVAWEIDDSSLPAGWSVSPKNSTNTTQNTKAVTFTFPANTSTSGVTEAITGSIILKESGASTGKTVSVTQEGTIPTITFDVNRRQGNFPNGTNSKTVNGVTLSFSNIEYRDNNYLELTSDDNTSSNFVISIPSGVITNVVIHYTDYYYGRSGGNRSSVSTSIPATTTGTVYATGNQDTGTWTGSSSSVTFTMSRYSNQGWGWGTTDYEIRISSIEVTYRPE